MLNILCTMNFLSKNKKKSKVELLLRRIEKLPCDVINLIFIILFSKVKWRLYRNWEQKLHVSYYELGKSFTIYNNNIIELYKSNKLKCWVLMRKGKILDTYDCITKKKKKCIYIVQRQILICDQMVFLIPSYSKHVNNIIL